MDAKIALSIGQINFAAEGSENWVSQTLDNFYKKVEEKGTRFSTASETAAKAIGHNAAAPSTNGASVTGTLASFLKEKGAAANQVKKFLAAAAYLQSKGKSRLSTTDVTSALKASNQSRLGNPSDCLNKNVGKGHCEKDGSQFYVTSEGFAELSMSL